ncbi:gas vesicle protein GvpO [Actinomadura pelletieri DSM 43383]|uniref:Gas vesicle protein GvpO n=1 Tax=Actinomadura pelletieri DSM 43383 TaxID=1120940 RepID=A0A495QLT4_9ACTN|nr:gas vesicle protein GvpO [Actinomadura pelletieri]RKS73544.1 gas vesicle protein GvpO [Actinomadura pelletieri DSM 43383]
MMSASRAAERAVEHVTAMTGRRAESVVGMERADEGGWRVTVEVVETHRIPDSADILAVYDTEVDGDGELVAYRRVRRYTRGRVGRD